VHIPTGEIFTMTDEEVAQLEFVGRESRLSEEEQKRRAAILERKLVELTQAEGNLLRQYKPRVRKNYMRNKPCVCGSGKKFKKCCWSKFA